MEVEAQDKLLEVVVFSKLFRLSEFIYSNFLHHLDSEQLRAFLFFFCVHQRLLSNLCTIPLAKRIAILSDDYNIYFIVIYSKAPKSVHLNPLQFISIKHNDSATFYIFKIMHLPLSERQQLTHTIFLLRIARDFMIQIYFCTINPHKVFSRVCSSYYFQSVSKSLESVAKCFSVGCFHIHFPLPCAILSSHRCSFSSCRLFPKSFSFWFPFSLMKYSEVWSKRIPENVIKRLPLQSPSPSCSKYKQYLCLFCFHHCVQCL